MFGATERPINNSSCIRCLQLVPFNCSNSNKTTVKHLQKFKSSWPHKVLQSFVKRSGHHFFKLLISSFGQFVMWSKFNYKFNFSAIFANVKPTTVDMPTQACDLYFPQQLLCFSSSKDQKVTTFSLKLFLIETNTITLFKKQFWTLTCINYCHYYSVAIRSKCKNTFFLSFFCIYTFSHCFKSNVWLYSVA